MVNSKVSRTLSYPVHRGQTFLLKSHFLFPSFSLPWFLWKQIEILNPRVGTFKQEWRPIFSVFTKSKASFFKRNLKLEGLKEDISRPAKHSRGRSWNKVQADHFIGFINTSNHLGTILFLYSWWVTNELGLRLPLLPLHLPIRDYELSRWSYRTKHLKCGAIKVALL